MSMRMMRFFLPGCLFLIGASTAFAQTDPRVTMGGGGSCQSFDETSLTETFTHVQTGCVVDFTDHIADNDGVSLDILVVNIDTPFSGTLSCGLGAGTPLNTAFASTPTSCTFEDETLLESITFGSTYSLSFVNPCAIEPSCMQFPSFIDITLAPVVTPEPPTMLLLGVGLAVLLAGRKWLKVVGIGVA